MAKVIIWGTGQVAETLCWYLTNDSEHEVCAFCVDEQYKDRDTHLGHPVVAFENIEERFSPADCRMAIFCGYRSLNRFREEKYAQAKEKGYGFISYINSSTTCNSAEVGENTFVFSKNDLQPHSRIGNNVIIWSSNSIGHHTVIGDNCFLASTKVSGGCRVGRNVFLGTGSSIADNVEIGDYCIIGTGAVVTANVESGSILAVKQTPAMPLKSWDMEDLLG